VSSGLVSSSAPWASVHRGEHQPLLEAAALEPVDALVVAALRVAALPVAANRASPNPSSGVGHHQPPPQPRWSSPPQPQPQSQPSRRPSVLGRSRPAEPKRERPPSIGAAAIAAALAPTANSVVIFFIVIRMVRHSPDWLPDPCLPNPTIQCAPGFVPSATRFGPGPSPDDR